MGNLPPSTNPALTLKLYLLLLPCLSTASQNWKTQARMLSSAVGFDVAMLQHFTKSSWLLWRDQKEEEVVCHFLRRTQPAPLEISAARLERQWKIAPSKWLAHVVSNCVARNLRKWLVESVCQSGPWTWFSDVWRYLVTMTWIAHQNGVALFWFDGNWLPRWVSSHYEFSSIFRSSRPIQIACRLPSQLFLLCQLNFQRKWS